MPATKEVILGVEKLVPADVAIFPSIPKDLTPVIFRLPILSIPAFHP